MSGRRIDDHSFWAGKGNDRSIFPEGVHTKGEDSAEGAGAVREYQDTTDSIKRVQDDCVREIKRRPLKSGDRY